MTAELAKLAERLEGCVTGSGGIDLRDPALLRSAATALRRAAQQDADDQRGMIWWNSLSDEGREKWVQPSGRAVDAWMAFKLAQQDVREFERLIPSRLAEAFGVSWERAQKAQDNLGWLYRRRASLKPNGDVEQGQK